MIIFKYIANFTLLSNLCDMIGSGTFLELELVTFLELYGRMRYNLARNIMVADLLL